MKNRRKAFTLIELLVVIAIIGILATISVLALNNARAKSRDAKRAGDMKQIQTALELFFNDKGRYPNSEEWATGQIFSTSTNATSTYMQIIPSAPNPADGNCTINQNSITYIPVADGSSYSISFCLGNTTGTLTPGPKCLTPAGILDVNCAVDDLTINSYLESTNGDPGILYGLTGDNNSIFSAGVLAMGGSPYAFILKQNKATLQISTAKSYGYNYGGNGQYFYGVASDDNYVYAVGFIDNQGGLLVKYDKNLNIVAQKKYYSPGGSSSFSRVVVDGDYLYVVGNYNSNSGLIMKYDKSDLSQVSENQIYLESAANVLFYDVAVDDTQVYAVGNFGGSPGMFVFDKNLSEVYQATYDNGFGGEFHGVDFDDTYVYVAGKSLYSSLLMKLQKSDGSIVSQKAFPSTNSDSFNDLDVDGQYVYAFGYASSELSQYAGLISKHQKSDLGLVASKYYYVPDVGAYGINEYLYDGLADGDYLYLAGKHEDNIDSNTFIFNQLTSFRPGSYESSPSRYSLIDNPITLTTSDLVESGSILLVNPMVFTGEDLVVNSDDLLLNPTVYHIK